MNRKTIFAAMFLVTLYFPLSVFGQDFATEISGGIYGAYLPAEYVKILERTKNNPRAWAFIYDKPYDYDTASYDVVIVDFYTVSALPRTWDIFREVSIEEILKYRFEDGNNETLLTDDRNNRYKNISNDIIYEVFEEKKWEEHIGNFIGKIILDTLIQSGDIILEKDIVTFPALDNKKFRIQWQAFDSRERRNLQLESISDNKILFLEIRTDEYIFYGYHYFSTDIVWSKKF